MTSRERWVARLDGLTVVLLAAVLALDLTGGFRVELWGVRLSARSPWRAALFALAVAVLRHAVQRRPSLFDRLRRRLGPLPPIAGPSPRRLALETVAACGLFAAVTIAVMWTQATSLASVPDRGDPLFSVWRLSWIAHQIVRDPVHLFDANIFHPDRWTLAYSDAILLPGLVVAPALWLGAPAVAAYNVALLLAVAASGGAMYALARALTGSRAAAAAAGVAFAFHAYRFAHYSHFELQIVLWSPLALLALHRAMQNGRTRDGVVAGMLIAAQAYSCLYYGLFLCVFAAAVVLLLGAIRQPGRPSAKPLAAAVVTVLLLALPLAFPYARARTEVGQRTNYEVLQYSAQPRDYFAANSKSRWYYPLLEGTTDAERQLFPGVVVLALALAGASRFRAPGVVAYTGALVVAFDCSLGLNGGIYPWLHQLLPPFRGLRAPARFGTFVALSLSVLAGYGVLRLQSAIGRVGLRRFVAACAIVALAVEGAPRLALDAVPMEPPGIYSALPRDSAVVLAEIPFPASGEAFWLDPTYMYFSTFHWRPLVNGNSGYIPLWYSTVVESMTTFPSDASLSLLRQRGATHLIVHGEYLQSDRFARTVRGLDARHDVRLLSSATTDGRPTRLYDIGAR